MDSLSEKAHCLIVLLRAVAMFVIERFLSFIEDQMAASKKKGPVENQPVTFKTKIKSSGYTVTPRLVNISLIVATYPPPPFLPPLLPTTAYYYHSCISDAG